MTCIEQTHAEIVDECTLANTRYSCDTDTMRLSRIWQDPLQEIVG
jgi:hypothetical protein